MFIEISALSGMDFLKNNLVLLRLKNINQSSKLINSGQSRFGIIRIFNAALV